MARCVRSTGDDVDRRRDAFFEFFELKEGAAKRATIGHPASSPPAFGFGSKTARPFRVMPRVPVIGGQRLGDTPVFEEFVKIFLRKPKKRLASSR
jgi:hypothetical protein